MTTPGSKFKFYYEMNPSLSVHQMYEDQNINEHDRIVATRIRLSSHDLAVEKGRWSRTPRENCLCSCGEIQTEEHVVCFCPRTSDIRHSNQQVNFQNLQEVFDYRHASVAVSIIRKCYEISIS